MNVGMELVVVEPRKLYLCVFLFHGRITRIQCNRKSIKTRNHIKWISTVFGPR